MATRRGQRGPVYDLVRGSDLLDDVLSDRMTRSDFAEYIGKSQGAVTKALNAILYDRQVEKQAAEWVMEPRVRRMLAVHKDGSPQIPKPDKLRGWAERTAYAFIRFSDEFFETDIGQPYLHAQFEYDWIVEILIALHTGGRLLILSPPRHGKSEMMVRFAVWLIARNPNIRILWVGGNEEIASTMVSSVRDHLETNFKLIDACLPPEITWAPQSRTGAVWTSTKFRVANRTVVGQKGFTMVAVGRSGKILSRDADLIVGDDIEDLQSTEQPKMREQTRVWATTQLESRKTEQTAEVFIGSRQHPDDLWGHLLEDDEWKHIVNTAHDPDCTLDPTDVKLHTDCMLFPKLRSYRWLRSKYNSAVAMGLESNFEMVYLNITMPEEGSVFVREEMEECLDVSRGLGLPQLKDPDGNFLPLLTVAGLDPAATGRQAGFLWAYSTHKGVEYMVDLSNRRGGGIDAFLALAQQWLDMYGCRHWVIEDMGFQRGFRTEQRVQDWAAENGVLLEGHTTGRNKTDPLYGVGAMSHLYRTHLVNLPYAGTAAKEKTNLLIKQALGFSDDRQKARNRLSDVLMSSWFPQRVIEYWRREHMTDIQTDFEPSYSGYSASDITQPPW